MLLLSAVLTDTMKSIRPFIRSASFIDRGLSGGPSAGLSAGPSGSSDRREGFRRSWSAYASVNLWRDMIAQLPRLSNELPRWLFRPSSCLATARPCSGPSIRVALARHGSTSARRRNCGPGRQGEPIRVQGRTRRRGTESFQHRVSDSRGLAAFPSIASAD